MTDRCWDELRRAGNAIAEGRPMCMIVDAVALDFDLPRTPEEDAVHVFLDAVSDAVSDLLDMLAEAGPPRRYSEAAE